MQALGHPVNLAEVAPEFLEADGPRFIAVHSVKYVT